VTPIVEQFFPDDPKCQWFRKMEHLEEGGVRYAGLDVGFETIGKALAEQGPFDGVLGFSQGAALSFYTAAKQQNGELVPPDGGKLKFAIIIAGFTPRDLNHRYLFNSQLETPTCHIWGDHDVLKFKSEEATKNCVEPLVLNHKAGHKVPKLSQTQVGLLSDFIHKAMQ